MRQALLKKRSQLSSATLNKYNLCLNKLLCEWLESTNYTSIAGFWPINHEPDLRPFLIHCQQRKLQVALPHTGLTGQPLVFKLWELDAPLKQGRFGIAEPDAATLLTNPEVILVPTLGFTPKGDRMGYGQGFYDRTLAQFSKLPSRLPLAIGIAYNEGLLPTHYQPQPHDYHLDKILTPAGWVL